MKKVLVTGGAGFIGSHTVDELLVKGYEVFVLDNLSTGCLENFKDKKVYFIEGDIQDKKIVDSIMKKVDCVIHLAAIASVFESVKNPIKTHEVNVTGTLNVFISALENNVKRVVYASSDAVYGNNTKVPLSEDEISNPVSPYGLHKSINEKYAQLCNQNKKTEFIGLRYFNVYGPRQSLTGGYPAVVPNFCLNVLRNKLITIFGDGKQYRDFIYVKDLAKINVLGLEKNNLKKTIFNVGTGQKTDLIKLIKVIEKNANLKAKIKKEKQREGDIKKSLANISNLNKEFKPIFTDFSKGIAETLEFYLEDRN
jgi:UDP-glucose 4-epimerase